jgi:cytochrome oxidase Cu insertion factor (SCO1/SenC/PrrC family)
MTRSVARVLRALLAGLLVCIPGCFWSKKPQSAQQPDDLGTVAAFSLVNQDGNKVTRKDLKGKVWIAGFIFTRCVGPCTRISGSMARLQKELPAKAGIALVSFTVDPQYDKPRVLKEYAERFRADSKRWTFVTGDKKAVYELIRNSFKLGVEEATGSARKPGNEVTHSTRLALVDRRGHIRGYYDGTEEDQLKKLREAALELAGEQS